MAVKAELRELSDMVIFANGFSDFFGEFINATTFALDR
jgi:hypothetical protein